MPLYLALRFRACTPAHQEQCSADTYKWHDLGNQSAPHTQKERHVLYRHLSMQHKSIWWYGPGCNVASSDQEQEFTLISTVPAKRTICMHTSTGTVCTGSYVFHAVFVWSAEQNSSLKVDCLAQERCHSMLNCEAAGCSMLALT